MAAPKLETMSAEVLEGGIGLVKYNRPKNANALGAQTMADLLKALTWALEDPSVKVVVLSGEGKFYSAGMDLVDVPAEGPVLSDEGVELLRYASERIGSMLCLVLMELPEISTNYSSMLKRCS